MSIVVKTNEFLNGVAPGIVADAAFLERLLASCWNEFEGSNQGGMEAYKLLHRMENVHWTPPVLAFVVERHGGNVCGSTRAELHHWKVDLDARSAVIIKTGHGQIERMAARVSVKSIAEEVAQAVLDSNKDERLHWLDKNTVKIRTSLIFPTGSGFKMTVEGRRKTLCHHIDDILSGRGWVKKNGTVFVTNGNVLQRCDRREGD